jgi:hypothetical protein
MTGLRQKILLATSEEEVKKLVAEGKTYEFASVKTRNSWGNAARRKSAGEVYSHQGRKAQEESSTQSIKIWGAKAPLFIHEKNFQERKCGDTL